MNIRITGWSVLILATLLLRAAETDDALAMGRKALRSDGVATAWKAAQKAVSDAPESAPAHEFAGEVLFRRGEFAQSEAEFKLAAKLDANYALAWWGLARVSECQSMNRTAIDYFRRAHTLDPNDPRIFRDWAIRLPGQQQADALEKYSSMMEQNGVAGDAEDLQQRLEFAKVVRGRPLTVLASAYTKSELPLEALVSEKTHMRSYGLEVSVNGNVFHLMLDTGASGIVIPRKVAEKAGVVRLSQATMRGFGDSARLSGGYRGVAQRLRIGDVEYRDALISVADQDSVGTADGLIGSNVFAQFLVTLDFTSRKLRLDPLPGYHPGDNQAQDRTVPSGMEHATQVFRFGHLLFLPTRINGSRETLFIIDTGADRTLISYDLAAEVSKLSRDPKARMGGINGRVTDLYQTGDLWLQFAGFEQRNLGMSAIDTWEQSRRLGTDISGFLGLPVINLFTLTIDYRDGLVNFDRKAP